MDLNDAYSLILQKISTWIHEFIHMVPNIILAAIVFVVGIFIARSTKRISQSLIVKISKNPTLNSLLASVVYFSLIGIVFFIVLSILRLDKAVTSILAGAGIIGLALAFAFQDIAANFISGVFISFRRPIKIGDIVKISDYMGKITDINLRDTVLLTFQGQIVIIPNKNVFQNPIENYSLLGKRRLDLEIGVSYGEDLEKVQRITIDAVKNITGLSDDDETTMYYKEFGESSINYIIRLWLKDPEQSAFWIASNQVIINIKKAYDQNNITIPFPIRTLDFGIKGGKSLNEIKLDVSEKNEQ
ncbi:MAG: mechanosensitive ion channel family protein [Chitinophagales bacterium]